MTTPFCWIQWTSTKIMYLKLHWKKKRCGTESKKVSYIVRNVKRFRSRFNYRNHFRFGTDYSEKFEKVSTVNNKKRILDSWSLVRNLSKVSNCLPKWFGTVRNKWYDYETALVDNTKPSRAFAPNFNCLKLFVIDCGHFRIFPSGP